METLKTIKRFEIGELLGEGGMATVYKAYDISINRHIALKFLRSELSNDHEFKFRFMREGKTAGSLLHPNIVTIYDIAEQDEEQPYIAMEYLDGKNLGQIMTDSHRLPIEKVVEIGIQLADGLSYAHERGVIHRDIKPSNIIFSKDTGKIKITDFGVAHIDNAAESEKTKTGMLLGTPHYMSPEQIKGIHIDGRSDLFSVGVVLYQLITGDKPFRGNSIIEIYQHIIEGNYRPISEFDIDVHPKLIKIVDRLINKDPKKRFQSASDLGNTLRDFQYQINTKIQILKTTSVASIRTKWTAIMIGIVAFIMLLGIIKIYSNQYDAVASFAFQRGASLIKLIALENVETVLLDDWIYIQKMIEKINEQETFNNLMITDRTDTIRGSTDTDLIGEKIYELPDSQFIKEIGDTRIYKIISTDGTTSFYFETPLLYQNTEVGKVRIELEEEPIRQLANSTLFLLLLLSGVMMIAIGSIGYLMTTRLFRPIEKLKFALTKLAEGNLEYRIAEKRTDEFGELFSGFNQALRSLNESQEKKLSSEEPYSENTSDANNVADSLERSEVGKEDKDEQSDKASSA